MAFSRQIAAERLVIGSTKMHGFDFRFVEAKIIPTTRTNTMKLTARIGITEKHQYCRWLKSYRMGLKKKEPIEIEVDFPWSLDR